MRIIVSVLFILTATQIAAQVSFANQKSLNAYSAYANRSGEEVTDVVETMFKQYEVLIGKYPDRTRYTCPFQMDDYYLTTVNAQSKNTAVINSQITIAFQNFRSVTDDHSACMQHS